MTIGPQKDEKDDKSPKRWQTLEKMTTDNSAIAIIRIYWRRCVNWILRFSQSCVQSSVLLPILEYIEEEVLTEY